MWFFNLAFLLSGTSVLQAQSDWPMKYADLAKSSWAKSEFSLYPPFADTLVHWVWAEQVCFFDHHLYYGSNDSPNKIGAYDPETRMNEWFYPIDSSQGSIGFAPPASENIILGGGQICTGLHAINRFSGKRVWFRRMEPIYYNEPVIDHDRVFICNDSLYCLDLNSGQTIWTQERELFFPVVDEQLVYAGRYNNLYAFHKNSGESTWERELNFGHFTIDDQDLFMAGVQFVECMDKSTGNSRWQVETKNNPSHVEGVALSDDLFFYVTWFFSGGNSELVALDKGSGNEVWTKTFDVPGAFCPTVANGVVYVVTWPDGTLWAFQKSSGLLLFMDSDHIYMEQPIVANHSLYIPSTDGLIEFTMKSTSDLPEPIAADKPIVYPNPCSRSIRIRGLDSRDRSLNFNLFDLSGKCTKLEKTDMFSLNTDTVELDIPPLPGGMYLLQIRRGESATYQKIFLNP